MSTVVRPAQKHEYTSKIIIPLEDVPQDRLMEDGFVCGHKEFADKMLFETHLHKEWIC